MVSLLVGCGPGKVFGVVVEQTLRGSDGQVGRLLCRITGVRTSKEPSVFGTTAGGCDSDRLVGVVLGSRAPVFITAGRGSCILKCTFYICRCVGSDLLLRSGGALCVSSVYISRTREKGRVNGDLCRCIVTFTRRGNFSDVALGI